MAADPRRIVGSMVEAKACHVTSLAECARRYGSNSKTKKVQGIVTHVEVIKNSTTNRTTTFVTAAYDLGGTTIRPCRLNIRSVKAVPTPTAATVPTGGGALLGSADGDSTTTEVSTQPTSTIPTLAATSNTNTSLEQPTVAVARATPPLTTENNENCHRQQRHSTSRSGCDGPRTRMVCRRPCNEVACEWQLPFSQLGSQNEDGIHAGPWWRPPKLVLTS